MNIKYLLPLLGLSFTVLGTSISFYIFYFAKALEKNRKIGIQSRKGTAIGKILKCIDGTALRLYLYLGMAVTLFFWLLVTLAVILALFVLICVINPPGCVDIARYETFCCSIMATFIFLMLGYLGCGMGHANFIKNRFAIQIT